MKTYEYNVLIGYLTDINEDLGILKLVDLYGKCYIFKSKLKYLSSYEGEMGFLFLAKFNITMISSNSQSGILGCMNCTFSCYELQRLAD
ncbi:hypothetical protein [Enterobacter roggenkampii]|uniref:hypothetical protein n=1 Tax=Enterobacter roggenkampii TaxID=1812935 RepID=UPI0012FFA254|nr:hypothetical protein [Enterobacter roggenkampii]QWZ75402.1 hypothetical protein I6L60_22455 [Enterobacter roggenkampii]